jgi:inosine-uridine nucleoside N-ribohydrolase
MRTKILIDCDPGHDDAVALLYAAKHLELVGVTTCHGNNTIGNVTRNALSVLTLGAIAAPLAQGCADPLIGHKRQVSTPHGKTGLDGSVLPEPDRPPLAAHAVDFLIDMAHAHQGELVLAVIGPATNVALAIKREPRFVSWLREITVMGGSAGIGNITPVAEFNVWCDPEAAAALFASRAHIRMVGYDLTGSFGLEQADIERLLAGGRVARHVGELMQFALASHRERLGLAYAPLHDVCAIVPYVEDGLIDYRYCNVGVELAGRLTRGMTVCDMRSLTAQGRADRGVGEANAHVAVRLDSRRLIAHVMETLLSYA